MMLVRNIRKYNKVSPTPAPASTFDTATTWNREVYLCAFNVGLCTDRLFSYCRFPRCSRPSARRRTPPRLRRPTEARPPRPETEEDTPL